MARPIIKGKVKIGKAKIHDYVLPKEIVYLLGGFGGVLLLAGLILVLVGLNHMPGTLKPWGFVLLGLGWCFILMSMILCCHAFCIKPTRSNPNYINSQEPRVVVVKKGTKKAQLQVVPTQAAAGGGSITIVQPTHHTPAIVVAQTSAGTTPEYEDRSLKRDVSGGSWSSRPTSAVAEKDFDFQYYSANQVGENYGQQGGEQRQVIVVQQAPQNAASVQAQNSGFVTVQQNETKRAGGKQFYIPSSAQASYAQRGQKGGSGSQAFAKSNEQQVFVVQQSPSLQQRSFTPIGHDQQILVVQQSPSLQQRQIIAHQQPIHQPVPQHIESRSEQSTIVYQDQQNIASPGAVLYRPPPSGGVNEHHETKTVTSSTSYGNDIAGNMAGTSSGHITAQDQPILVQTVNFNPQPQRATMGESSSMVQQSGVAMGSNIPIQQAGGAGGQYQNEYSYSYSYQHGDQHAASAASGSTEYPRRGSLYDN
ncbi:uncharacterized protein LOC141899364 [Tubulanus polymorphus]|uniref:uncharacterized protein LOC141899364 n=1 Tax=Tubulanus polymorphus TaxID=672921 RepID=UPI003DA23E3B